MCMTTGASILYVSHSGDPDGMEDAAIYKVHRQVRLGRQVAETVRPGQLDRCRNENELRVGEMTNWRVQKVTLRAAR